ncbi:MAG: HAMP domain-containing sensor histidine kinase [Solibacillus sp.]|uniref:sensor histidine kinase n=1 Tax=Solibacillus sp. TaxID=1909654 RepID=UPI003315509F
MHKISVKLATYFFVVVLIMELVLMFYLHQNMLNDQVRNELDRLMETGQKHRDVLEGHYSDTTLEHITLMEQGSQRAVVILNEQRELIVASSTNKEIEQVVQQPFEVNRDKFIQSNWQNSPYIVSVHAFHSKEEAGYVLMFQKTVELRQMNSEMNYHFILSGIISGFVLLIAYVLLSRFLTKPLIQMKKATESLSRGHLYVQFPKKSNDELGELAIAIEKLAQDLRYVKEGRNEFLAAIAHELSTPLTYLNGYATVLQRPTLSNEERMNYLAIIAEESVKMKSLVQHLLDAAKLDDYQFPIIKQEVEVAQFLEQRMHVVALAFAEKNIAFSYTCDANIRINADPQRLEQILLNLLENARHYSNQGAKVTLTVLQQKHHVAFIVEDTGIGIDRQHINFIFDKLYRVEKSRARSHGGMGLGLAIVKQLVEAHGGKIEVTSTLGKGSTFTVLL